MTPEIITAILASIGMWGFFVAGYMLGKTDAERNRIWAELTFEQVEDCFPDGYSTEDNGILVSAQWLHDYARAIEAKLKEKNT